MPWKFPLSTNTSISLGTTDKIYVAEGVVVGTQGTAISGTGQGHIVEVYGTVISALDTFTLGSLTSTGTISVQIGASGHVISTYDGGPGASAITLFGGGGMIVNDGEIRSTGYGVFVYSSTVTVANTIINNGIISGESGVESRGDTATVLHLINTGTIVGGEKSYGELAVQNATTSTKELITNTGLMQGDIYLTGGDDTYNGQFGTVRGIVSGGNGTDKIYGGSEKNVIDGGAGTDRLQGGKSADTLTGGTESDTFVFKLIGESTTAAKGRDTIIDFNTVENDTIDLHSIDANSVRKGNQAFDFIGVDTFNHLAGELRYKVSGSDSYVYGDVDGDGKSDFAIKLDGVTTLHKADFDL